MHNLKTCKKLTIMMYTRFWMIVCTKYFIFHFWMLPNQTCVKLIICKQFTKNHITWSKTPQQNFVFRRLAGRRWRKANFGKTSRCWVGTGGNYWRLRRESWSRRSRFFYRILFHRRPLFSLLLLLVASDCWRAPSSVITPCSNLFFILAAVEV